MSGGAELDGTDQSVDMSGLNLGDSSPRNSISSEGGQGTFTFIPPDPRAYYRRLLKACLTVDLADEQSAEGDGSGVKLLSKPSLDLLNEVAVRWRIPSFTRMVLFLDVIREKYQHQEASLEILDAAFLYVRETPLPDPKKGRTHGPPHQASLLDRSKWTVQDLALYKHILSTVHDALLRELFDTFQHCYENKPPSIGAVMYVLENHIYDDEAFDKAPEDLDAFASALQQRLKEKARLKYQEILAKNVSDNATEWEFYNVVQLGKAVTGLCEKIQKRYKKNPEVMGANPLGILVEEILPSFADDAKALVTRIMELSKQKGEEGEVPIQDGFDLYRELVELRRFYAQALPGREFTFHIEELLQQFVWRWIALTDDKMIAWIEGAVAHDDFQVRQQAADKEAGIPPTEDERRSQSAMDIYRIFNQSIDQIAKLEWDDDLQYAKFMTAVSKSIGKGVARYCELLEIKFAKEMDRQTPEQEMRAQQSQRDKWLSAAKEAWATGGRMSSEKIEPFQFWPESFVKINDIEYATMQLDKVEKEINVDACAAVIQERDPSPPPNVRGGRGSKFMFTIKIIEAEDLKAGDVNGLSDPYVVLGDEYQKRLAKTRTVYQSLNPRWDETVDILTTGPLNVIATVWDWDMVGDHDCLGRTSLKLDPSHFNDYLPREYWLDLDTQGRVLVRVSMEGERDDIQFYFGKAFRTLKRTERDMARKVTDKLSAYIQQCLSRRTLRALLGQGTLSSVTMHSARGYFSKLSSQVAGRPMSIAASGAAPTGATPESVSNALKPLLQYFDDNFAIMKQTLTDSAMIMIMTRLWKETLVTIEGLLVPPLSDKPSGQKPLTQQEVDIVYRWLQTLFDFFHAYDEEDKVANGVPLDVLKSPKYHDLQNLNFFYFESTDNLIRTSDGIAQATARRQQETAAKLNRFSAPSSFGGSGPMLMPMSGTRRTKSILMSRNLGTMRKAKEEKRKEAQADPNDDMILRILRMRPEAERYLKDRSRQKERLAAAAAAEAIVRQSLQASRQAARQEVMNKSVGARRWDTIRE
ncbi:c2 domain containing protein [Teratosphaeria destructans]|uniref:C2 domain containing protein n=1 Tax=Teratosphaeria destructans TaxID=418781 RepID=A0A9W7SV41_9PEZI|nr:c2 domain containing protein [Teratosphaeria destructans]